MRSGERLMVLSVSLLAASVLAVGGAQAEGLGHAVPWQLGLQPAASPVMEGWHDLWGLLLWVVLGIPAFVFALLIYALVRFRAKQNPVPSRTAHNTALEMIWTIIPALTLVVIAVPSLRLQYFMDRAQDAEMTIKAVGHQWYWSYEYPDHGNLAFDAIMVAEEDLAEGQPRLLATDNEVVLPVDTTVRILVTADDVIHAWAVPALGVKADGTPGRVNETWVRIEREGTYYGMCSELCGVNHAFMPIAVRAVSREAFAEWVEEARARFARAGGSAEEGPEKETEAVRLATAAPAVE